MPRLRDLVAQRAAARAATGRRTSIARVLVLLGCSLVAITVFLLSLTPVVNLPAWIALAISAISVASTIALGIKYKKGATAEQVENKVSLRSLAPAIAIMLLLLGTILFGLWFFITLSVNYDFSAAPAELEIVLVLAVSLAIVVYFSASPFIMATWYRTAPAAARFVLKVHRLFHWKRPGIETRVLVTPVSQDHSIIVALKRAFTWLIFSTSVTFIAWIPIFDTGALSLLPSFSSVDSQAFAFFTIGHLLHLSIPVVITFFLFAWLVPPCYLLDDAGVVFFRRYATRRQPLEVSSISSWFLDLIKAVLGTGALISYVLFVIQRAGVISIVASQLGVLAAIQYALFIFGFPFTGTLLMAITLMLFQETQFNKLKTFLYQQLVRDSIDPRVVDISFHETGQFQDKTLLDYHGENFFHAPPLRDSVSTIVPRDEKDPPEFHA